MSAIHVVNVVGRGQRRLTRNLADDFHAAWSPDGRRIAFVSNRDENNEIYVMNADGSRQRNLSRFSKGDDLPVWSPDGRMIAFVRDFGVYVMSANGRSQKALARGTQPIFPPAWSPDGRRIAFTGRGYDDFEIYTVNADATGMRNLTHTPPGNVQAGDEVFPVWSRPRS